MHDVTAAQYASIESVCLGITTYEFGFFEGDATLSGQNPPIEVCQHVEFKVYIFPTVLNDA